MRCPECKSRNIIKKGKRNGRYGSRQRYYCKDRGRRFIEEGLKYKMYLPLVIYNALNYYNLGYSFKEVSRRVNKMFKVKTSKSTIHCWINEFHDLCPVSAMRFLRAIHLMSFAK